jgi:membrane protease YdiL (CAAX protease family)
LTRLFRGDSGLRTGWRLLIFITIIFALFEIRGVIGRDLLRGLDDGSRFVFNQSTRFVICLLACLVMTKIENRTIADYGLPWRRMFQTEFWVGAVMGFLALTVLLLVMKLLGVFDFGSIALHGGEIWKWAAVYGVAFLIVALSEEFFYRGYPQFTLSSGIGFWPAAIVANALFGLSHSSNHGETPAGLINAGLAGLFFCLLLQRSGNLWMPIGFHLAWDWAQTFFYGVPDSGIVVPGHLFNSKFSGAAWLTGGSVGPEGSWLCTAVFALLTLIVLARMRVIRYPPRQL